MSEPTTHTPCTNELLAFAVRVEALPLDVAAYLSTLHGTPAEADALRLALGAALRRVELLASFNERLTAVMDRLAAAD